MVFSIKNFVFWSSIGCKITIFGTNFRLRNWFGDSNANCHFTTEICMFVPSNLYMKSNKVSYNCFFFFFSWKRMEKLKNIYLIYKFMIGCLLLSSHPVLGFPWYISRYSNYPYFTPIFTPISLLKPPYVGVSKIFWPNRIAGMGKRYLCTKYWPNLSTIAEDARVYINYP